MNSTSGFVPGSCLQQRFDSFTEWSEVLLDHSPRRVQLHAELVMDEYVAHTGNLFPRNLRGKIASRLSDLLDGLADDLKIANDGVLHHRVCVESLTSVNCVAFDPCDGIPDVLQIDPVFLHSGTASARIRSSR